MASTMRFELTRAKPFGLARVFLDVDAIMKPLLKESLGLARVSSNLICDANIKPLL